MTMYIRLKRKNQTLFMHIEPSNNFFQIKQRVAEMFNIDTAGVTLISTDKVTIAVFGFK